MINWNLVWLFCGVALILLASFAFQQPSLSPAQTSQSGFQIILGILGLAGVIYGIVKR